MYKFRAGFDKGSFTRLFQRECVRVCTVGHTSNFEEHNVKVFESLYGCNSKHFDSYTLLLRIL